jgi:GPH family glycoside/pentoside/hexuronide:cation symporter
MGTLPFLAILTPWIVPILYAFQFIKVSENTVVSAVVIVAAASSAISCGKSATSPTRHSSAWPAKRRKTCDARFSRATWNNIGGLLFPTWACPLPPFWPLGRRKNQFAAAAFCLGILMVLGYYAHFRMTKGYEEIEVANAKQPSRQKASVKEMFASFSRTRS